MNIKKWLGFLFIIINLFYVTNALAVLDLELTQGINAALPIAIVPFTTEQPISKIINQDLSNSGKFNITPVNQLKQTPHQLSQIDFSYWRKLGVDNLVIGHIQPLGNNKFKINFNLLNIYASNNSPNKQILLGQSFTVNKNQFRSLAHHISDLIYKKLTGERGIFSTKIAYILVQQKVGTGDKLKSAKYYLKISDIDGFNPRTLLISNQPIMSPAWSPNGKQIAYVSFENKRAAIYIATIATGQRQLITDFPGINGAPAWSPDGKKLAVVLSKTGSPKIYTINLTNKKLTQLTRGPSIDTEPSWSPNGKSLIFTSNRGGGPQIYRINLASHKISRVTYTGNYNARPSFTPNGENIVMLHRSNGLFNIAEQNLQTGRFTQLTDLGLDESPSIAPNGHMVVYATQVGGRGVLAMVSTDGKVKLRLPSGQGNVQEPAWSPYLTS